MKYYIFKRESNNFNDILTDPSIKKYIEVKLTWNEHLIMGLMFKTPDSVLGYVVLKYGDDMTKITDKDYTPLPNIDYTPIR